MNEVVNLAEKLGKIHAPWRPRIVARLNDHEVRLARLEGEFVWHSHPETDELFLVIEGQLRILMRGGVVTLGPGDLYVVPRGVEHCPVAENECGVLLLEPSGTLNTGDAGGERTAPAGEWV